MPAPGRQALLKMTPIASARVVTPSKYSKALMPTLPTFRMFFMLAMPCTTVQKMIGAISILIILMKASPKGFIASAQPRGSKIKGFSQSGTVLGSGGDAAACDGAIIFFLLQRPGALFPAIDSCILDRLPLYFCSRSGSLQGIG